MPDEICEFVHSVGGINMVVAMDLTESTATVSCFLNEGYEIGSVGTVMPDVEVKIGENNEILLRGKTITTGYYKKPEVTAAAIDRDGWFYTGDAGYLKDSHLYLTERIKDLFKTSNGKYILPQALETKLAIDRYIDQIVVIADERKFVSAFDSSWLMALMIMLLRKALYTKYGMSYCNIPRYKRCSVPVSIPLQAICPL